MLNLIIIREKERGEDRQTWKVIDVSGARLRKVVFVSGTDECIIHPNDSHMFRLSESPTNITRFPLHLFRNAAPSNLHLHFTYITNHHHVKMYVCRCWCYIPWDDACIRLPRVLEELFVRSTKFYTVELTVDEGTRGRIIKRVRCIVNPFSLEQVTTTRLLPPFQHLFSSSSRGSGGQSRAVALAHIRFLVGSQGLVGFGQDCEYEKRKKKEKRDEFETHLAKKKDFGFFFFWISFVMDSSLYIHTYILILVVYT